MSDETSRRVEQFRQMAEADPGNELGHYSLGRAYLDNKEPAQAIAPLQKALELNPNLGRAYELLAQAFLQTQRTADAIKTLTTGVTVADARGERLSRDAMVESLKSLNAPVPSLGDAVAAPITVPENQLICVRCNKVSDKLPKAPFRNEQGKLILAKVCRQCWQEWLEMGTKVINELRLPMHELEGQQTYERHMLEFLNLPSK